jgi:acetyltransferase-like isoleucine patch superfamily enzyme
MNFIKSLFLLFIVNLPGKFGNRLRVVYYKKKIQIFGKNIFIDTNVYISGYENIEIMDNVWIGKNCIIDAVNNKSNKLVIEENSRIQSNTSIYAYDGVKIKKDTSIAEGVKIFSSTHTANDKKDLSKVVKFDHTNGYQNSPGVGNEIIIGENNFIGLNSIILPGVNLGKNSFVGINSVVYSKFKENSYIMGNPARRIKNRFKV